MVAVKRMVVVLARLTDKVHTQDKVREYAYADTEHDMSKQNFNPDQYRVPVKRVREVRCCEEKHIFWVYTPNECGSVSAVGLGVPRSDGDRTCCDKISGTGGGRNDFTIYLLNTGIKGVRYAN